MTVTEETRHNTASMVVLSHDDRVLLVHHLMMDLWVFPGGHVDDNEAPHEAALREVLEETGVQATLGASWAFGRSTVHPTPVEVAEYPAPAKPDRSSGPAEPAHSHIDFLYAGRAVTEILSSQEDEVKGVHWATLDEVAALHEAGWARPDVLRVYRMVLNAPPL